MGTPPPGGAVVLDTTGICRMYNTLKPPVIQFDDGPKPILQKDGWLDNPTASPAAGWAGADFDDGNWVAAVARRSCKTPYLDRLCLRGRFEVTDPTKAKGLAVTVEYHGGIVVYLNGTEIGRRDLPAGPVTGDTLAAEYPLDAFVTADGNLLNPRDPAGPEIGKRLAVQERSLSVAVPANLLRKGLNVLGVEIIRAPYDKIHGQRKALGPDRSPRIPLFWYTCELRRIQLTASSAEGIVPNATRPQGFQVFNSDSMMSDFDMDYGDPTEPLRPVRIVAARNGAFSGKVVVGSTKPIRGLKATATELKGPGGTIPASAVRFRCAVPWGEEWMSNGYGTPGPVSHTRAVNLMGALAESLPQEIPVREKPTSSDLRLAGAPDPVVGAVAPVWFTVAVPKDAKPGVYTGQVLIEAQGEKSISVPVELRVADWALPDTLSAEYGLEPWSDKHWKMIEHAFDYLGQTGSRVVHVPLIAQDNLGQAQSMVRWIKKPDGKYDYDFTIMDKYLDAAAKHMGKPKIVVFWVWDIYMIEKEHSARDYPLMQAPTDARLAFRGKGPLVTVLDPATGKTHEEFLLAYKDPNSKAMWAPLMKAVQERIKARGWEKAMMLGMLSDTGPTREEATLFHDLLPDVPWASQSHAGWGFNQLMYDFAKIGYQARVWEMRFATATSMHGWNNPMLMACYDRDRELNPHTPALWGHLAEMSITGDQRGTGRLGGDYWPAIKDKGGRRAGYVWTRYPQSSWRNLDLWSYTLAPGADGPVATTKFETFREGVQHCEARIFIEQALVSPPLRAKLGDDLAKRCQESLDERQVAMVRSMAHYQMNNPGDKWVTGWRYGGEVAGHIWFVGSGWQERSERLYTLAGEVERKLRDAK